jgi:N-acetylneuraminic acid mutarotase
MGSQIYVFNGGDASLSATNSVYIYDIAANTWSQGPDSTIPTFGQSVVNLNGHLYRIGGGYGSNQYVSSVYDYGHGFVAPLPAGRAFAVAVALGGYIYLAGGDTAAGKDAKTYRYDPVANLW